MKGKPKGYWHNYYAKTEKKIFDLQGVLADRWYDDKQVSDKVVEKGYKPLIRARSYGARGKASKLRDKQFSVILQFLALYNKNVKIPI